MKSNEEKDHVSELPLDKLITGANYRRAEADSGLIESIRVSGIPQPLLVRPAGKKYEIVCGHRRFPRRARLETDSVPVLVRTMSDYKRSPPRRSRTTSARTRIRSTRRPPIRTSSRRSTHRTPAGFPACR